MCLPQKDLTSFLEVSVLRAQSPFLGGSSSADSANLLSKQACQCQEKCKGGGHREQHRHNRNVSLDAAIQRVDFLNSIVVSHCRKRPVVGWKFCFMSSNCPCRLDSRLCCCCCAGFTCPYTCTCKEKVEL